MAVRNEAKQAQQGFTLVEIMIALVVFSVIMLGLAAGLTTAIHTNKMNAVRDGALSLAEEEINRLKGEQFSAIGVSAALAATVWTPPVTIPVAMRAGVVQFTRSTQITDLVTTATPLKRIDVAVGWDAGPSAGLGVAPTMTNRQVSLSAILVRSDQ